MVADIQWRNPPLDVPGVPVFIARDALPDPATARCELCDRRRERFKVGAGTSGERLRRVSWRDLLPCGAR
jgi:hypothetical protein